jgi:hypothetical protein
MGTSWKHLLLLQVRLMQVLGAWHLFLHTFYLSFMLTALEKKPATRVGFATFEKKPATRVGFATFEKKPATRVGFAAV